MRMPLRPLLWTLGLAAIMLASQSSLQTHAQTTHQPDPTPGLALTLNQPTPATPGARQASAGNPVIASVEGHLIYLSDLRQAARTLPPTMRALPFDTVYPALLERLIDHESVLIMARRDGLDQTAAVQRKIRAATRRILEGAYLQKVAVPRVTDQEIRALYQQEYANRQPVEEVRARHILVSTRAQAMKIIKELQHGANFAAIAKIVSQDPDAAQGGELGFFRRQQVWPAFADVAFSLQPGQVAPYPVRNEFGWQVIKVEERRVVAPPTYAEVKARLRARLLNQAVVAAVRKARDDLIIHKFNLDGTELRTGLDLRAVPAGPAEN